MLALNEDWLPNLAQRERLKSDFDSVEVSLVDHRLPGQGLVLPGEQLSFVSTRLIRFLLALAQHDQLSFVVNTEEHFLLSLV